MKKVGGEKSRDFAFQASEAKTVIIKMYTNF